MRIKAIKMIQHMSNTFEYSGYTVLRGMFYGVAITENGEKLPCFWSGWTSGRAPFVYIGRRSGGFWIDEEDGVNFTVFAQPEYWAELESLLDEGSKSVVPFFF